jgi:hypothetical protein
MFVDFSPVDYLIVLKRGGVGTQGYGAQGQGVLPADQDGAALGQYKEVIHARIWNLITCT